MVETIVAAQVIQASHGTALGVGCSKDATIDAGIDHEARAHKARFERHVNGTSRKAPSPKGTCRFKQCEEFRMSRRVFVEFAPIMRAGDHATLKDHHRTNRHLACLGSKRSLIKCHAHKTLIFMSLCHYEPFADIHAIRCYH